MIILELLLEVIIIGFISNILGKYTRYYFLKIIGRERSVEYLSGNSADQSNRVSHGVLNFLVGVGVLFALLFIVVLIDMYLFHFL